MKRTYTLEYHPVATHSQMVSMIADRDITVIEPRNRRHHLFLLLKHGLEQRYRGPWGRETLLWDGGDTARVFCTHARAQEIQQHIADLDHYY